MPGCTCQRAKSPRKVREKVPAPNPPTGAPCQKPSSMWDGSSKVFFVPGFSSVLPIGRFQATLEISSLARAKGMKKERDASRRNNPRRKSIKPPDMKRGSPKDAPGCKKTYRIG